MKRIVLLILVFWVFLGAATAKDVTIDEAAEMALAQNLTLLAGSQDLETLARGKRSTWNEFFPELYAAGGFYRLNEIPDYATSYYLANWNVAFTLGGELALSAGTGFRMTEAARAFEAGAISYQELESRIVTETRKAFLGILLIRETIVIWEDMIETAFRRFERAKLKFELGESRKTEMLSFQVEWETMKPTLSMLNNAYNTSQLEFKRLIGVDPEEPIALIGIIDASQETFDPISYVQDYLGNRYDVRYLTAEVQRLKAEKGIRVSDTMTPTLDINYSFRPYLNDPTGGTGTWSDLNGGLGIFLKLPLDGYIPNTKKNLTVKAVSDQIASTGTRLEDALRAGAIDIESNILDLNTSAQTIATLELNVELAQETYDLVERSWQVGEADYIQVQTAFDNLNQARIELLNEEYKYSTLLEDLAYNIARPLDEFRGDEEMGGDEETPAEN